MSHGLTDTIPKQSSRRHNGNPRFSSAKENTAGRETVNNEFYLDVMRRLREAIRRKRPVLWAPSSWMLHHDGAPAHTANLVQQFLTKHGTIQVARPPYSPDMSPSDFSSFPRSRAP
ncbi:histone-lysine n-methyltransferase setmar-like protein [Trichonephila clavipes]|nr:histone-lysine n-methyltransferase setmar-like protein [Trichonephila clavipes]